MDRKKRFYITIILFLAVGASCYYIFSNSAPEKKVKYIAMIGKFTDQDAISDEELQKLYKAGKENEVRNPINVCIETCIEYYLEKFSEQYPDVTLKLKVFDNRKSGERSRKIYEEQIAPNDDIIGVVDFTWGSHLKECASTIKKLNIPVITINPDHNNLDFGNNALFVYNDDETPRDLAAFIKNSSEISQIDFISEADYPPHENYLKEFKEQGVIIDKTMTFNAADINDSDDFEPIITMLEERYRDKDSAEVRHLVINSHSNFGDSLLKYIDANFYNMKVCGPVMITTFGEGSGFGKNNGNEIIMIDKPRDALSKRMTKDLRMLKKLKPEIMSVKKAEQFIKRSYDAVALINQAILERPDSVALSKASMCSFINSCPGRTILDKEDMYTFNNKNATVKDLTFSNLRNDKVFSYKRQMNTYREIVPNMFFGMEVQDIFDLDVSSNSFSADFYYWVKMDTADAGTENFISFQNMKQSESTIELIIEEVEGDILYKLYRVSGIFFVDYKLADFPMDEQEIDIIVEILRPVDEVKVSFDKSSFEQDTTLLDRFKVPGWDKIGYFMTVNNHITKSLRGDPKHQSGEYNKFKTVSFSLDIKRTFLSGFLEIILPLVMISFISIGLLYTKDLSFATMGEVSVGTFLGIIAFSISLSEMTPSSNYLTKADLLFWLSFGINFLSFMVIIFLNSIHSEAVLKDFKIKKLRMALSILYPLLVVIVQIGRAHV